MFPFKKQRTYNFTCTCCRIQTNIGYIFDCFNNKHQKEYCKSCYQNIKQIKNNFNHNRHENQIINQYNKTKNLLLNDKNSNLHDNLEILCALNEELIDLYNNHYLAKQIDKNIEQIYKKHQQIDNKSKLAEKFNDIDFRKKWPREYQCEDGHYVRSKSEKIIDDWLHYHGYIHTYEKSVFMPNSPNDIVLCDFYLQKGDVYIEFWGLEDDEKYNNRKEYKIKLYDNNNIKRIDLTEKDIKRMNDIMPRLLAKYIK